MLEDSQVRLLRGQSEVALAYQTEVTRLEQERLGATEALRECCHGLNYGGFIEIRPAYGISPETELAGIFARMQRENLPLGMAREAARLSGLCDRTASSVSRQMFPVGVASRTSITGTPSTQGYYLTAVPTTIGMTGHRGFASSSRGVVFFDKSGAAPTEESMAPGGGGLAIQ